MLSPKTVARQDLLLFLFLNAAFACTVLRARLGTGEG